MHKNKWHSVLLLLITDGPKLINFIFIGILLFDPMFVFIDRQGTVYETCNILIDVVVNLQLNNLGLLTL